MEGQRTLDAHVHLDWFADPARIAREADALGLDLLCCTVGPEGFRRASALLGGEKNVRVAAGLHPWWVDKGTDLWGALDAIQATRWVGEVGLDFGRAHEGTKADQIGAFQEICRCCATVGDKVLSIHSVHAAGTALDILESTGTIDTCTCIFHWFSGTSEELRRAIDEGCLFSVGERMLATRRGREYARQIPVDRLLLETDLPEGRESRLTAPDIASSLDRARNLLPKPLVSKEKQRDLWRI